MNRAVRVIDKEIKECPICEKKHELEICEILSKNIIKGEEVEYYERFYRCNKYKKENTFMNEIMWNSSLVNGQDAYRMKNGLLTSFEIKEIRSKYKVTQSEFALMLGLGKITITRYETKQIQEFSNDCLLREVNNNAILALRLLEKNKVKFSKERYNEIFENIKEVIDKETISYLNEQLISGKYINYNEKTLLNGMCLLNIDKLKNILAYITYQMKEIKKVVLMKLLWYIDSLNYKINNKSLTGLVYVHMPFGALPIASEELLKLSSIKFETIYNNDEYKEYKIFRNPDFKIVGLTKKEKDIIDKVINKFKNFKSSEISEYMHKEDAYIKTEPNEIISFEYAKKLKEI